MGSPFRESEKVEEGRGGQGRGKVTEFFWPLKFGKTWFKTTPPPPQQHKKRQSLKMPAVVPTVGSKIQIIIKDLGGGLLFS